ncbi:Guanosine polyphosphate pyrophosphohydrolases/synthetases [hydrothermal vent metagenome]|uniref:Guanosine polyphosphate pyrophosphohydrolases/synthetases n=1 Tax=hydrothermal vent metagenome TaxID=652676 RepID=A0A1W1C5Q1_9ZZZZ
MSLENIIEYENMKSWYINDIKNTKVLAIYELNDNFEIHYEKDGVKKLLSIYHWCHFGPMHDGCWFEFSSIELQSVYVNPNKKISQKLKDIDTIEDILLYEGTDHDSNYTDLEIVYKNKNEQTKSYLLKSEHDEEEVHRLDVHQNKKSKLKKVELGTASFPKELYSTKIYKDTLAFALKAHKEQKTPEGLPYSFHIVSVANEIINSLSMNPISYDEANVAIACALLHDVNEDTDEEVSKYTIEFPTNNVDVVASGVSALTKDTMLPSKQEQMKDSLKRLKQMPKCVQMVKLADRITNLAPAPAFWNKNKRKAYVDEAKFILRELGSSNEYLAKKLQNKIESYEVDFVRASMGFKIVDNYLVFFVEEKYLILDKNHKNYLKTFKALNRLNEYVKKEYDLELFTHWQNEEKVGEYTNRVDISYIMKKLNTKGLLDLNKQIDEKIERYFTTLLEGEDVIL